VLICFIELNREVEIAIGKLRNLVGFSLRAIKSAMFWITVESKSRKKKNLVEFVGVSGGGRCGAPAMFSGKMSSERVQLVSSDTTSTQVVEAVFFFFFVFGVGWATLREKVDWALE
jgi:hypothetical protein